MNLTVEKLELIKEYGKLKYPPSRICTLMGFFGASAEAMLSEFKEEESKVRQYYEQGLACGDYEIDIKLHEAAEKADVPSIVELSNRQYNSKINDLKKQLFGL